MNLHPIAMPEASVNAVVFGRLFFLELSGGRIHAMNPDGSSHQIIVTDCRLPDGIVVDAEAGHIYWTNMGAPHLNDGSIERADLDGKNRTIIAPEGATHTPKQIQLDKHGGKLYWCDREGMRVMRVNLDGSNIETLVRTGSSEADRRDATKWCVGITLDPATKKLYWTQKGPDNGELGRIFRAGIDIPAGESPDNRSDVELFLDGLPEPIDLEFDHERRMLYWTDRGDPPRGNTVNRIRIKADAEWDYTSEILSTHLMEGIGLALDLQHDRMFVTDLGGSIYSSKLDGSDNRVLRYAQGNLAGIAFAEIFQRIGEST